MGGWGEEVTGYLDIEFRRFGDLFIGAEAMMLLYVLVRVTGRSSLGEQWLATRSRRDVVDTANAANRSCVYSKGDADHDLVCSRLIRTLAHLSRGCSAGLLRQRLPLCTASST